MLCMGNFINMNRKAETQTSTVWDLEELEGEEFFIEFVKVRGTKVCSTVFSRKAVDEKKLAHKDYSPINFCLEGIFSLRNGTLDGGATRMLMLGTFCFSDIFSVIVTIRSIADSLSNKTVSRGIAEPFFRIVSIFWLEKVVFAIIFLRELRHYGTIYLYEICQV